MSVFKPKSIVCAYKNFEELKKRYPNREITPHSCCSNDEFIVMKKLGTYVVSMRDWKVYEYKYKYVLVRR